MPLIKKTKDDDLDDVVYLKTTPSHPRDRFARNSKIELEKAAKKAAAEIEARESDVVYVKTTPSHPRQRLECNSRTMFEKAAKQAPAEIEKIERFKKRCLKLNNQKYIWNLLLCVNCQILIQKVTKTSLIGRENQIYNGIIKQLPPDNDKYDINYSKEHDAYIVRKEK